MGREGVAQAMRMDVARQADAACVAPHELPDHLARPRLAARAMKHEPASAAAGGRRLGLEVRVQVLERDLADRDHSLLAALAERAEHAAGEVDVAQLELDQLGNA